MPLGIVDSSTNEAYLFDVATAAHMILNGELFNDTMCKDPWPSMRMCRRRAACPIFHVLRAWVHLLCRGVARKREKRHKKRESVISGLSLLYILYFFSCIIFSLKMIFSREIKIRLAVVCVHIRIGEISSKSLNVRENNDGESVCGLIGFRKKRGIRRIYKK